MEAVAAITLAAASLRFPALSVQSLWLDEAVSVQLVRGDFGTLVESLRFEASPPLYYVIAFGWTHLFGSGEFAFRSLSALAGRGLLGRGKPGPHLVLRGGPHLCPCDPA